MDKPRCPQCQEELTRRFTTGDPPKRSWICRQCDYQTALTAPWTKKEILFAIWNELMQIRELLKEKLPNPDSCQRSISPEELATCGRRETRNAPENDTKTRAFLLKFLRPKR